LPGRGGAGGPPKRPRGGGGGRGGGWGGGGGGLATSLTLLAENCRSLFYSRSSFFHALSWPVDAGVSTQQASRQTSEQATISLKYVCLLQEEESARNKLNRLCRRSS